MITNRALLYDWLHQGYRDDIPFWLAQASADTGPILQPGCGTGRVLLPMAAAGHLVTGLDHSVEMLDRLRSKQPPPGVTLLMADMARFTLAQHDYGLALFANNTLLHLDPTQLVDTFYRCGRHLRPGGRLLFDIVNPLWLSQLEPSERWEWERDDVASESGDPFTVWTRLQPERDGVEISWRFTQNEVVIGTLSDRFHLHYPHALAEALEQTGFRLRDVWGDYDEAVFDEESERLIMRAVRV